MKIKKNVLIFDIFRKNELLTVFLGSWKFLKPSGNLSENFQIRLYILYIQKYGKLKKKRNSRKLQKNLKISKNSGKLKNLKF